MPDFREVAVVTEEYFTHLLADRPARAPIKAVFVCHRFVFWACFAALIAECARRGSFESTVLIPHEAQPVEGGNTPDVAALRHLGVRIEDIDSYDMSQHKVEIAFFQTPYVDARDDRFSPQVLMLKGIRPVLIPYCTESLGGGEFLYAYFVKPPFYWRVFTASVLSQSLYLCYQNMPEKNVPITGNPEYDMVVGQDYTQLAKYQRIKVAAKGRRIVLWAPHFSSGESLRWCTWDILGSEVIQCMRRLRKEVFVVFRPHHFLVHRFAGWQAGTKPTTSDELNMSYMHGAGNFYFDFDGLCIESVLACDAVIADCSSLLAKGMALAKSVLYTARAESDGVGYAQPFVDEHMHTTESVQGVQAFLEMLLKGEDPKVPAPQAARDFFCGAADGKAAVRIADLVEEHFRQGTGGAV
ncbi:MAG: hypothetical protein RRY29_09935 [Desulfovibrionaceae bacterium]